MKVRNEYVLNGKDYGNLVGYIRTQKHSLELLNKELINNNISINDTIEILYNVIENLSVSEDILMLEED